MVRGLALGQVGASNIRTLLWKEARVALLNGLVLGTVLALIVLTAIGTIGFVDRIVISALVEPLKDEFKLNDAQIGLLGFAYSALNIVLGVAIAGAVVGVIIGYLLLSVTILRWSTQ